MLVRVFDRESVLWFVAADVARALEFKDARDATRSLPENEKGPHKVRTLGGEQTMLCVTEQGLYRLIFRSNKEEAKRFQDFVFYEVLPQIRKTGSYRPANDDTSMTPQQMDIRLALDMVREARLIHGKQRAARLWESLPMLPRVPEIPVLQNANHAAGAECLAHLLAYRIETGESVAELITLAMESGDMLDMRLRSLGIRPITEGEPGIAIATNPVLTGGLFHDTRWDKGRHIGALRSLPGVISFRHIKVQRNATSSSIFIPSDIFDTDG
ncbi:BRO-N domain-containing protein [Agrobacterium vitis]|uniref:BRO-N domain-containing protein n=1 Tax=Agrobacterium vitis TaxID=373 RepID=UPI001F215406|nr:Bro-N domain-containing protein [Agrobacterium vitis]